MTANCTIFVDDGTPFDPATILSRLVEVAEGRLTTDHPASSYGQPVLALDDGRVMGPGDVPDEWQIACCDRDLKSRWMALRPVAAG